MRPALCGLALVRLQGRFALSSGRNSLQARFELFFKDDVNRGQQLSAFLFDFGFLLSFVFPLGLFHLLHLLIQPIDLQLATAQVTVRLLLAAFQDFICTFLLFEIELVAFDKILNILFPLTGGFLAGRRFARRT